MLIQHLYGNAVENKVTLSLWQTDPLYMCILSRKYTYVL